MNVPSQFPRKFAAVARPNVMGRSWLLGNSPPTSQAYGAEFHVSFSTFLEFLGAELP